MRRHQAAVVRQGEAAVNEQHNALVPRGADDPPGRLQHLVHAGVAVGIVKAAAAGLLKVIAQLLLPGADLRQPGADNGRADETVARKVDAFAKDAAQHRKAEQRRSGRGRKLRKEGRAGCLVHFGLLAAGGQVGVLAHKFFINLLQVSIAWEKGQVVARARAHHGRQTGRDAAGAGGTVAVARADAARADKREARGVERAAQRDGFGVGQAAQILIIPGRAERGAEQHRRAAQREIRLQKSAGVQAELGGFDLAAKRRELQNKVLVEGIGHAQPGAHVKIELQQRGVGLVRFAVLVKPGFERLAQAAQQRIERFILPG